MYVQSHDVVFIITKMWIIHLIMTLLNITPWTCFKNIYFLYSAPTAFAELCFAIHRLTGEGFTLNEKLVIYQINVEKALYCNFKNIMHAYEVIVAAEASGWLYLWHQLEAKTFKERGIE